MAKTTFAAPILPGKTDAWKAACAEIAGAKKDEYIASRKAIGITKETACLQETPHGDYVVVYLEGNDLTGILQKMTEATDSFSTWFKEAVLKDVHGMDSSSPIPPTNSVFIDIL